MNDKPSDERLAELIQMMPATAEWQVEVVTALRWLTDAPHKPGCARAAWVAPVHGESVTFRSPDARCTCGLADIRGEKP